MAHTFCNLLTHVIFSTKDRVPHLDAKLRPRLFPYMGGIIERLNSKAMLINATADHVHLLVSMSATMSVAELLRVLKANSSRWIHEQYSSKGDFGWQIGYAAFSVSKSNEPEVLRYIANQEEHHRRMSFQEELIRCLKKHGIPYDERYIWE